MKCYLLGSQVSKKSAWACAPDSLTYQELIPELNEKQTFPFRLQLKKVELRQGDVIESDELHGLRLWDDLLPGSYALSFISERLRSIIENNLTGSEKIEWISADVAGAGVTKKYFVAKFSQELDVLDFRKTKFGVDKKHIIIPYFSSRKIANYSIFHKPGWFWQVPTALYVGEKLRKIMKKEKITGVSFEEVQTV